jgi:hypothetical protein
MPKFNIVIAYCDRYEVEAENEDAAVKQIKDAHYKGNLKKLFDDQLGDSFTKFESEGKIVDEEDDDTDLCLITGSPAGQDKIG